VPSALVAPAAAAVVDSVEPAHRLLAVLRRHIRLLAAVLALAFVVPWLFMGQHGRAGSFFERGTTLLGKAKTAVVATASAVLAACVGLKVRTGEKSWLEQCSPEARKIVTELDLETDGGSAILLAGPNVIIPDRGVELRDGPVEASAMFSTTEKAVVGRLFGEIRTGIDGASVHFTRLKMFNGGEPQGQPPTGREVDLCAIASVPGYGATPGIPLVEPTYRPSEGPHAGFVYVTTHALEVHLAH